MQRVLVLKPHGVSGRQIVHAGRSGLAGLHQKPEVLTLALSFRSSARSHVSTLFFFFFFAKKAPLMNSFEASF